MFSQEEKIILKIKKLSLISLETAKLYNEDNFRSKDVSLEQGIEGLVLFPKLLLDDMKLVSSDNLNDFEEDIDFYIKETEKEFLELKEGENAY